MITLLTNEEYIKRCIRSNTAIRKGIDNTPDAASLANLLELKNKIYDPICLHYNEIVPISSGFRCKKLNTAVGGSKTSDHMIGCALDIDMDDRNKDLLLFVKNNLEFKQLIEEYPVNDVPSWIHISYQKGKNRKEVLLIK